LTDVLEIVSDASKAIIRGSGIIVLSTGTMPFVTAGLIESCIASLKTAGASQSQLSRRFKVTDTKVIEVPLPGVVAVRPTNTGGKVKYVPVCLQESLDIANGDELQIAAAILGRFNG
jgi:hypothetical protein